MNKVLVTILSFLLFFNVSAQEEEKPVKNVFQGTRFINLHSANVASKNELQMFIQHRFGNIRGGINEFFGLDEASMRLGFEYGLTKNFTVGIGRSNHLKTYDSFLKYRILTQTASFPITATATVSGSVPTFQDDYFPKEFDNFGDKASSNVQLHVAKTFKYFAFQVSPGYINTGYFNYVDDSGISGYYSYSFFTVGAGGSVKLSKKMSFNVEYLYRFEDEIDYLNPLSASLDLDTGGHLFQIIISNAQQMFDQAIITNPTGDWTEGHLFLGFNLVRGFNFKQY